jgi:hypothetical protein
MTVRLAKTVKKGQKFEKFPVLFPVFRESGLTPSPSQLNLMVRSAAGPVSNHSGRGMLVSDV